jgi:hypothetical protein
LWGRKAWEKPCYVCTCHRLCRNERDDEEFGARVFGELHHDEAFRHLHLFPFLEPGTVNGKDAADLAKQPARGSYLIIRVPQITLIIVLNKPWMS